MTIHIYLEFINGNTGGLALKINGENTGLQTSVFLDKKMLYCELKGYQQEKILIGLVSLSGATNYNLYLVNAHTGGTFVQTWELENDRKELSRTIDIDMMGSDNDTSHENQKKLQHIIKELRSFRRPGQKLYKSTLSFNKELKIEKATPDYDFYDKQTPREALLTPKADDAQSTIVEVFYATDRKVKQKKKGRITYTNTRGDLQLGKCLVNVPANKQKGEIPLPPWYLFGLFSDEKEHMIIKEISQLKAEDFFNKIRDKIGTSPEKDAFIFVHGYNVDFTDSVLRAAQIATDIGFHGAPIVYSWPSRNSFGKYTVDEATISGYSTDNIIQLLKDVRSTTGAERVHLIAHSMGNRLLTDALKTLSDQGFTKDFLFNQIILAAPDIDAEVFVKHIAPKIIKSSERITLYTSQHDRPLWFSDKIHGGVQRTGTSGNHLAVIDGIDTIDTSIEKSDFLGHGYFATSRALIDDIFQSTRYNKNPEERNLRRKVSGERIYWEFF